MYSSSGSESSSGDNKRKRLFHLFTFLVEVCFAYLCFSRCKVLPNLSFDQHLAVEK